MYCQWQKNDQVIRLLKLGRRDSVREIQTWLRENILPYSKGNLRSDSKKGILYFVDEELELTEVGLAMVKGGLDEVQSFIDDGLIFPPATGEIDIWLHQKALHFDSLEVHPFRLIQKVDS